MQEWSFNQFKNETYIRYQRAGRIDAEPITRRVKMRLSAPFLIVRRSMVFFSNHYDILKKDESLQRDIAPIKMNL